MGHHPPPQPGNTIRTLIVDDERLARRRIRRLLEMEPDIDIAGECASGTETLEFLEKQPVDLLFLDVQMPGMDGLTMLDSLPPDRMPLTVFVTAYEEHALRAFEVRALDYLLKPFDNQRFAKTLDRVRQQFATEQRVPPRDQILSMLAELRPQKKYMERIAVKSAGKILFVRAEDIDWVEAADNYVCLHVGSATHLLRETMNSIESKLDPKQFLRIHRSTIIHVDRIRELQPWFRGDHLVILNNGQKLTLSRNYKEALQRLLGTAG